MRTRFALSVILIVSAAVLSAPGCLAGSAAQSWASVAAPASLNLPGAQSIGGYTNGCVSGAVALPLQDAGYQVMRLSRQRYYGHPDLIRFIRKFGQTAADQHLGTLLVGDLGQPRGGPTLSGHRSHQTGLDVDIWFLLAPQASERRLSTEERESWGAPSVVNLQTDTLDDRQWTPAHARLLELAAQQTEVERIFVNPAIKQALCRQKTPAASGWLRKIRPWWKHDDHFHVRLKCPAGNPYCDTQEPLPPGDGCDASLAWWFSAEAKAPARDKGKPLPPPPLPALCGRLLNQ
ncbi:MAG: penicillin-insensitive murein endopeptidase [Methylococcales bacterium]|nr:penicillin-insensitive murein endopeptidase [Methylococcales bacterium]